MKLGEERATPCRCDCCREHPGHQRSNIWQFSCSLPKLTPKWMLSTIFLTIFSRSGSSPVSRWSLPLCTSWSPWELGSGHHRRWLPSASLSMPLSVLLEDSQKENRRVVKLKDVNLDSRNQERNLVFHVFISLYFMPIQFHSGFSFMFVFSIRSCYPSWKLPYQLALKAARWFHMAPSSAVSRPAMRMLSLGVLSGF